MNPLTLILQLNQQSNALLDTVQPQTIKEEILQINATRLEIRRLTAKMKKELKIA